MSIPPRGWEKENGIVSFNGTKLGNFLIDGNAATKAIKIMESKIKKKNRYISI